MRKIWLPLMFLQIYVLSWLGWWLARLLSDRDAPSPFPDIDAAWDAALDELVASGISLQDTPVYLILGETTNSRRNFFSAARLPLTVRQAPLDSSAPLHVSANSEAIYLTCAGASLLGQLELGLPATSPASSVASPWSSEHSADDGLQEASAEPIPAEWLGTKNPPARSSPNAIELHEASAEAAVALLEPEPVKPRPAKGQLPGTAETITPDRARTPLRKSADEIALATARLRHLCNLLSNHRRPYCPLNGVLALLPFAAGENELTANQAGAYR